MDWILQNARLADDEPLTDVGIAGGQIVALGMGLAVEGAQTWDLAGRVLLPGLADIHTHLDKTYASIKNQSGTLLEAIELWGALRLARGYDEVVAAATRGLQTAVAHGLTAMRTHVDVDDERSLVALDAILAVRQQWRGAVDLQVVALGEPGGAPSSRAAMAEAMRRGADFVGGAPALTADPRADIDAAFALAEQSGKPLDLHIDETEDPTMLTLEYVAEQTLARGWQGRVTAGHCCSLAFAVPDVAARVMDKVAQAEITIVTLPSCNLVLMGRGIEPAPRGTTRVKELLARGVTVCAASDNVHDPFNPFGSYDLLQIANLNAHVAQLTGEGELLESLAMVGKRPLRAMGLPDSGLVVGAPADLVVVDCQRVLDAVVSPPARLATFKGGKLVVRTEMTRTWFD